MLAMLGVAVAPMGRGSYSIDGLLNGKRRMILLKA